MAATGQCDDSGGFQLSDSVTVDGETMPVPRSMDEFVTTDHFYERASDEYGDPRETRRHPSITYGTIKKAIEDGDVMPSKRDGCFKYVCEVGGVRWQVYVELQHDDLNPLITAYAPDKHSP